jgi:hypothetical protein
VIIASYEVGRRAATWAWVFLACFTLLMIPAAVAPVIQLPGAQGVPFLAGILMLWTLCYLVAFRAIYRLDLSAAELRWHGLLRGGAIPLGDLRTIRPRGSAQIVIESAGQKSLRVAARSGAAEFAADVKQAGPPRPGGPEQNRLRIPALLMPVALFYSPGAGVRAIAPGATAVALPRKAT